jgi:hypothetical protein
VAVAVPLPDPDSQVKEDYSQAKVGDEEWEWDGVAGDSASLGGSPEVTNDWSRDADEGLTKEEAAENENYDFLNFSDDDHAGSDSDDSLGVELTGRGSLSSRVRAKMEQRAQGKGKAAGSRSRRSELDGVSSALLPGGDGGGGGAFLDEEEEVFEDTETALYREWGLRSHWNIAAFLPEAAREFFLAVVGDVLVQYHVRWQNLDSERHAKLDQLYSLGSSVTELLQEEGRATGSATGMVVDGVALDDEAIESLLVEQMHTYCEKRYHTPSY